MIWLYENSTIFSSIPSTLDFDRFLWRKMATCFIENTRRSYGYAPTHPKRWLFGSFTVRTDDPRQAGIVFSHLFAIDHFSLHIEPVKPKRPEYME